MDEQDFEKGIDRRNFFRVATAGLSVAGAVLTPVDQALAQFKTDQDRLLRLASCTWPIRSIFKQRPAAGRGGGAGRGAAPGAAPGAATPAPGSAAPAAQAAPGGGRGGEAGAATVQRAPANGGWTTEQMKATYGEITMLDFPQATKATFPGCP